MENLFKMDWPYFTFELDGSLRTDDGDYLVALDGKTPITFACVLDAQRYLEDFDIRGTIR